MPFTITQNGPNIPDGTYKAQLLRVEDGIPTAFGTARAWYFLVDVDGTGEELKQLTSENTGPSSKSYKWLTALLGREPQVGETLEDPTGKTVLADIERNKKGFPAIGEMRAIVEPTQVEAGIPR